MPRRDPFEGGVLEKQRFIERDLAVLATELSEAALEPLANGPQIARDPADTVAAFA